MPTNKFSIPSPHKPSLQLDLHQSPRVNQRSRGYLISRLVSEVPQENPHLKSESEGESPETLFVAGNRFQGSFCVGSQAAKVLSRAADWFPGDPQKLELSPGTVFADTLRPLWPDARTSTKLDHGQRLG
jgi:hypothetical protein